MRDENYRALRLAIAQSFVNLDIPEPNRQRPEIIREQRVKTFYLPALGYSDTDTSRWLTVRLYERIDGEYVHDTGKRIGAWRRDQQIQLDGEVRPHCFALLRVIESKDIVGIVTLVTTCPRCGAVQEHRMERAAYAVQCPGCRRIIETEEMLEKSSLTGSIGEIDSKLSGEMRRLAKLQGYTVRASD